jgi:transcriptional regulator with XRE-family HTH domain
MQTQNDKINFVININMNTIEQLQQRRADIKKTLQDLALLTGLDTSVISQSLSGKRDSRISTCETLAGAMDASLMVIPNHLIPEVSRLLSGKSIGPDNVPSAAERLLRGDN